MTIDDFRRIALGMDGVVEGAHMNHPDFRINGRIFATIYPDGQHGMVKLTPDQQREFMQAHPAMFEPASGAWGRQGCTTVRLDVADEETVGEAMTLAWQDMVNQPAPKRSRTVKRRTAAKRSKRSGPRKRP